jgi:biotin transport system substrate-specific component
MSRDIATAAGSWGTRAARVPRSLRRAAAVLGFAVLTAIGARMAVPLPGSPVPFTFEVVAVLAAGFLLGPRLGAASQLSYLAAGAAGLPVFAAGGGLAYLLGPTGGYLLAYPVAALVVGMVAKGRGLGGQTTGLLLGVAAIYLGGVAWLAPSLGVGRALAVGAAPFVVVDLLKVLLVLLVGRRATSGLSRLLA